MVVKKCKKCQLEKDATEFYISKNKIMAVCKSCHLYIAHKGNF